MIDKINDWIASLFGSNSLNVYRDSTLLYSFDFGKIITYAVIGISAFLLCNLFWFALNWLLRKMRR
jgi:hypothetical protein